MDDFIQLNLEFENLYKELESNILYEDICRGRKGAILTNINDMTVPIVRTTTKYNNPAYKFKQIHNEIKNEIKDKFREKFINKFKDKLNKCEFNNGLIEIYDNRYKKMGFHSDQELDLETGSYIAIFSSYKYPELINTYRTLIIKDKVFGIIKKIMLKHNSVIMFSTETNKKYLHKIVLENGHNVDNNWLGITFRKSKTYINFVNNEPYINDNKFFLNDNNNFYKLKALENLNTDFKYNNINYTISKSDLLYPI